MRAVVQRVSEASVEVDGSVVARIGPGLLVLLGVAAADTEEQARALAGKIARLRILADERGRFDRSLADTGCEALVVSQFTLVADTGRGNRPSFSGAAAAEYAEPLYAAFCDALADAGVSVQRGVFGARMAVGLVNDGPVTLVLDAP